MAWIARRARVTSKQGLRHPVALAGLLLLALVLCGYYLHKLSLMRHQQEVEAELYQAVALRLDAHALLLHRLFDHADTIHGLLGAGFPGPAEAHDEVKLFLDRQMQALGQEERGGVFHMAVTDAQGRLVWSSTPLAEPVDLRDREYFRLHAGGEYRAFVSPPLIEKPDGRRTIMLTRTILGTDGDFQGISIVSVYPDMVSGDLALALMREGGHVLLVRRDGLVLASSDRQDESVGLQFEGSSLRHLLAAQRGVGLVQETRADTIRIAAWQQIPDWPVFVVHSLPRDVVTTEAQARTTPESLVIVSGIIVFWCLAVATIMSFQVSSARQAAAYAHRARTETDETLAALPGAAYRLDVESDGTIDWRNMAAAVAAVLGVSPQQRTTSASPFDGILDREGQAARADFTKRLLQDREAVAEYNVASRGQKLRRVREHARIFASGSTGRPQVAGVLADVTAQRELEAQLLTASKMATLGDMASGIAHEVNQPATAIVLGADLALLELKKLGGSEADRARERIEDVAQQALRLREVISHFRAFTGPDHALGPPSFERVEQAIEGLRRIVKGMLNGAGVTLQVSVPDDLPLIKCHLVPLEQVLVNLIVNARDAVAPLPEDRRLIELCGWFDESRRAVILTVRDHGTGFPADVLPHVFEPFFTTKGPDQGTGLGLSIVHATMKSFGGSVTVRNHPLGGAEVTLIFPRTASRPGQTLAPNQKESLYG